MYKFHNKIFVKVHFDTDFKRKLFCRHQNSNPGPSDSCLLAYSVGITFLIGICISQLDYFAPNCGQCSGGPSKGHKTTTEATSLSVYQRFDLMMAPRTSLAGLPTRVTALLYPNEDKERAITVLLIIIIILLIHINY